MRSAVRTGKRFLRGLAPLALLVLPALTGCLYMPPPPTVTWPIEEGEISVSLHLSSDLLFLERRESPLRTMGFFPCLRYGLSCDQEVLFFPWPAYRQWGGLRGGRDLHYHQVSLGKFIPVGSFVERAGDSDRPDVARRPGSFLGALGTEYLRYDLRFLSGERMDVCWMPVPRADGEEESAERRREELAAATRDVRGLLVEFRGRGRHQGALEIALGGVIGRGSSRFGVTLEPTLLALPVMRPPRRTQPERFERIWLPELRVGVGGGN